jgi:leader peptidase (prepilin peptidase)/N-methyltransferase
LEQAWVLAGLAFVWGLAVGSFLNVVIHRVPEGESIVRPRSRCPGCRTPIAAWDNIPLLSYLWLRGRCRQCGVAIPARYPLLELATGLLFAGLALRTGLHPLLPVWMAFTAALVAAAAIDFDHQFVPDGISLGGLVLALVVVPLAKLAGGVPYGPALLESLAGAGLGGGLLWIVGFGHARVSAALGRTFPHWPGEDEPLPTPGSLDYWTWFPGLGFGDVKLMALIGACLGPLGVFFTIAVAALIGLVWGGVAAVFRGAADLPFGFGPSIALAALAALLLPDAVLQMLLP